MNPKGPIEVRSGRLRLEIEFLRSLSGPDGRIPESDQALLERFSRFTMEAVLRTRPAAE